MLYWYRIQHLTCVNGWPQSDLVLKGEARQLTLKHLIKVEGVSGWQLTAWLGASGGGWWSSRSRVGKWISWLAGFLYQNVFSTTPRFFLFVLFLMVGAASTIRIKLLRDPPLFRPGNVSRPLHVTLFNWCWRQAALAGIHQPFYDPSTLWSCKCRAVVPIYAEATASPGSWLA